MAGELFSLEYKLRRVLEEHRPRQALTRREYVQAALIPLRWGGGVAVGSIFGAVGFR